MKQQVTQAVKKTPEPVPKDVMIAPNIKEPVQEPEKPKITSKPASTAQDSTNTVKPVTNTTAT